MTGRIIEQRTRIKAVGDKLFTTNTGISVNATMESEGVKVKGDSIYFGFSNRGINDADRSYYQTILRFPKPTK